MAPTKRKHFLWLLHRSSPAAQQSAFPPPPHRPGCNATCYLPLLWPVQIARSLASAILHCPDAANIWFLAWALVCANNKFLEKKRAQHAPINSPWIFVYDWPRWSQNRCIPFLTNQCAVGSGTVSWDSFSVSARLWVLFLLEWRRPLLGSIP